MPIKASLDGNDILAFQCDETEWKKLKESYLTMPCCGLRAIPKKSKLGNYFFAHHRRGECTSAPESAEHIYLKTLIAKLAIEHGYEVITEKPGQTPDGEEWIADVFCQKGKAKIAIEAQWSHQSDDEYIRRQKKYEASGVRAAWLAKIRQNSGLRSVLPYGHDIPVFGMKYQSDTKDLKDLYVPQFGKSIKDFVNGLLAGKLEWRPRIGKNIRVHTVAKEPLICWKCRKPTWVMLGLRFEGTDGQIFKFLPIEEDDVAEFIQQGTTVNLKPRKSMDGRLACFHCGALFSKREQRNNEYADSVTLNTVELNYKELFRFNSVNADDIIFDWHFEGRKPIYEW